jgi:hypothetical protein
MLSSIPAYYYGLGAISPYGSYNILSSIMSRATSSEQNQPVYTVWWVNGPLSIGSPVQILTGYSSVTGDETLDLGTAIGMRNGWFVTSQLSQSLNSTSLTGLAANVAFNLNLLWTFDKKADILLRSSASASATMLSTSKEWLNIPTACGTLPCFTVSLQVTLTRTVVAVINLALKLADTDVGLNNRMNGASTSPSSPIDAMANLSLVTYSAIGVAAAAVVGGTVYAVRRANMKKNIPAPMPTLPS